MPQKRTSPETIIYTRQLISRNLAQFLRLRQSSDAVTLPRGFIYMLQRLVAEVGLVRRNERKKFGLESW
jgi:hypothetical protein